MRKYILGLFVLSIAMFSSFTSGFAQVSEVFAGGEITASYIGDGTEGCDTPLPYEITLRFFRDDPGAGTDALPDFKDVFLVDVTAGEQNRALWTETTITLDSIQRIPQLPNICIRFAPILTDGAYYTNKIPVLLDANKKYKIVYGTSTGAPTFNYTDGIIFHSPENQNIQVGQEFSILTLVNTNCDTITTTGGDTPSNQRVIYNTGKNKGVLWNAKTEILETLCESNSYRFDLYDFVYDTDVTEFAFTDEDGLLTGTGKEFVRDSLEFRMVSVIKGENNRVTYEPGRSAFEPFPCTTSDPFNFNDETGVMTFTPDLLLGSTYYTAVLVVQVRELKKVYFLEDDGKGQGTFVRRERWEVAQISTRQLRFIIANENLCDDNLPEIESNNFNTTEQAWEFNCNSTELDFRFTKPMLYRSLSLVAPLDFRVFRGVDPKISLDQQAYNPSGVVVDLDSVNAIGEFFPFKLLFEEGLGPGNYVLFVKVGNDNNTLENRCGFFMPEFQSVPFIINRNHEYVFKDDDDGIIPGSQKRFCYPGSTPFNLDALKLQTLSTRLRADSIVWKYRSKTSPLAPAQFDTIKLNGSKFDVLNTLTIPPDYNFPTVGLNNETEGFWTVGVGLNFPYVTNLGERRSERCYGEDITFVEYFEHPKVSTVDIDLCGQDKWPVIRDLVDPQFTMPGADPTTMPINYTWEKVTRVVLEEDIVDPVTGEVLFSVGDTIDTDIQKVGGSSNSGSSSTGSLNDTLEVEGFGFGIGLSSLQTVKVTVTFPDPFCQSVNYIKIVKQNVNVKLDIEEKDTTICAEEAFGMMNTTSDEYFRPDLMTRQWYHGEDSPNQMIEGDTTDTLSSATMRRLRGGWYKLVVTKTTDNSTCFGADSIFVRMADSLVVMDPICSIVTSKGGEINQRFYWDEIEGADHYEVRGINTEGKPLNEEGTEVTINEEVIWYRANDTYGIHHWILGKEVRLMVRGVNTEVPEGVPCKYGEPGIAEACEVLVKPVNVFTPNGDGINDLLRFDLLEIFSGNKLQVYNRWGKLVYESNDYQNDWDGGDLKDGTYFYILDIDDPSGTQDIFKGTITILR